jgi:hypothetical protein
LSRDQVRENDDNDNDADYRDYHDQNSTFTVMGAERVQQFHLSTDGIAETVAGAMVSGNYFDETAGAVALVALRIDCA